MALKTRQDRQGEAPGQRASSADACRSLSRLPARGEIVARFLTGSLNCRRAIGIGLLSPFIYQRHGLKRAVRPRPAPRKSSDVGRFGYSPHYHQIRRARLLSCRSGARGMSKIGHTMVILKTCASALYILAATHSSWPRRTAEFQKRRCTRWLSLLRPAL